MKKRIKGYPSVAWVMANKNSRIYEPTIDEKVVRMIYMGNGYTLLYKIPRLSDNQHYMARLKNTNTLKYIEHCCLFVGKNNEYFFKQDLEKEVLVYITYLDDADREKIDEEIMLLTLQSS
jgi:hypothetical protein